MCECSNCGKPVEGTGTELCLTCELSDFAGVVVASVESIKLILEDVKLPVKVKHSLEEHLEALRVRADWYDC